MFEFSENAPPLTFNLPQPPGPAVGWPPEFCLPQNLRSFPSSPKADAVQSQGPGPGPQEHQSVGKRPLREEKGLVGVERPRVCVPTPHPTFRDVLATLRANLQLINFLDICIYHECM